MNEATKNRLVKIGGAVATVCAVVLGVVCFVGAVMYAAFSVYHLFSEVVKVTPFEAAAAALSSVGLAVAALFIIVSSRHNYSLRAMGGIVLLAGVMITLPLVAVDASLRTSVLTNIDTLIDLGRIIAAILPALALGAVVALVISMNDTTPHKSAAAAVAKYAGFGAKFAAILASVFASAYFGISRGIDPILAVFCGVLLESAFLWSYFALKRAQESDDGFDIAVWSVAVLCFGAFIAAVSVETLSSLAKIDVPIVSALGEIGASLYVSAVGLSLVLTVITALLAGAIDWRLPEWLRRDRSQTQYADDGTETPDMHEDDESSHSHDDETSQHDAPERDAPAGGAGQNNRRKPKDRSEKQKRCAWCKTPFTATDGRAKYCSAKCRKAASRAAEASQNA